MLKVLSGCLVFLSSRRASPLEIAVLLGHFSWFALMVRASFACFHKIYTVSCKFGTGPDAKEPWSTAPNKERVDVSRTACSEVLFFLMLLPFLEVDLTRDWQEHLIVCDASDAFGFGVAVARAPKTLVREVGRLGQKRDRFVLGAKVITPTRSPSGSEAARQYVCLWPKVLAFSTVVSARCKHAGHSGALEGHGVTLALRWTLRAPRRHSKRTTLLIDAKTVLGGVAKGRSSAPTLRREIRRIGAYVLAGDLLLKPVYIPSEDNPGDAPSRGIVRRWRSRRTPALRASKVSAVTRAPVAKRHAKQAAKHKHDRFYLQAYSSESMRRLLTLVRLSHVTSIGAFSGILTPTSRHALLWITRLAIVRGTPLCVNCLERSCADLHGIRFLRRAGLAAVLLGPPSSRVMRCSGSSRVSFPCGCSWAQAAFGGDRQTMLRVSFLLCDGYHFGWFLRPVSSCLCKPLLTAPTV